jgi:hypothetical protein
VVNTPGWRPTATIARVLVWVLGIAAVGQVLAIPFDSGEPYVEMRGAFQAALDGREREADRLISQVNDTGSSMVSFVNTLTLVMTVLLVLWAWRSGTNARALRRTGERVSPVLGIFGWIVPVVCWVMPYVVVQDLWRSSDPESQPGTDWRSLPGAVLVRAWWICFAGGQVLVAAAIGLAVTGESDVARTDTLLTVAHVVTAIGAVLTIPVVMEITRRQGALQQANPAPFAGAVGGQRVASPTMPGDAGWYGDPSGQHEQRYWDGSAWTERVLAQGEQSYAPVRPAAWYPDPTGRFALRYWTGYAWTEHVTRDDELFIDPVTAVD